jgi:hypothetical protein
VKVITHCNRYDSDVIFYKCGHTTHLNNDLLQYFQFHLLLLTISWPFPFGMTGPMVYSVCYVMSHVTNISAALPFKTF